MLSVPTGTEISINVTPALYRGVISLGLTTTHLEGGRFVYSKEEPITARRPYLRVHYSWWLDQE